MKKIPLKFVSNQIKADMVIDAEPYRIRYKPMTFIVDTGSPRSFISERDAKWLNIPLNSLSHQEPIRMGGSKYDLFETKKMAFVLKTEEGASQKIVLPRFAVSKAAEKTEDAQREAQSIPSILGTDFFVINSLLLHFDPGEKEVYLAMKE